MARPRRIDPLLMKRAHMPAATATSVESRRQCQAVLLPALCGATRAQMAHVLGVGRVTVARLQAACRKARRATASPAHPGGRTRVLEPVGGPRRHWQPGGGVPDSSGPGAPAWPAGQTVGGVPVAGPSWLANGRAGHTPPTSTPEVQAAWKKTSPPCRTPG